MPTPFNSRRRIGFGLLLFSCWLVLMLARSYWIEDVIVIRSGTTTIDGFLVSQHRLMWARYRYRQSVQSLPAVRWTTNRVSIDPYTFFHRLTMRWHNRWLGFERAGYADRDETDPQFVFWKMWAVSYWSLIVPLLPLSIALICWPARKPTEQSPIELHA